MSNNGKPDYNVFTVEKRYQKDHNGKIIKEIEPYWFKIGAAFKHAKGDGLTIQLSALPLSKRLVIRPPKTEAEKSDQTAQYTNDDAFTD